MGTEGGKVYEIGTIQLIAGARCKVWLNFLVEIMFDGRFPISLILLPIGLCFVLVCCMVMTLIWASTFSMMVRLVLVGVELWLASDGWGAEVVGCWVSPAEVWLAGSDGLGWKDQGVVSLKFPHLWLTWFLEDWSLHWELRIEGGRRALSLSRFLLDCWRRGVIGVLNLARVFHVRLSLKLVYLNGESSSSKLAGLTWCMVLTRFFCSTQVGMEVVGCVRTSSQIQAWSEDEMNENGHLLRLVLMIYAANCWRDCLKFLGSGSLHCMLAVSFSAAMILHSNFSGVSCSILLRSRSSRNWKRTIEEIFVMDCLRRSCGIVIGHGLGICSFCHVSGGWSWSGLWRCYWRKWMCQNFNYLSAHILSNLNSPPLLSSFMMPSINILLMPLIPSILC
ncbi:hypothetical protein VP01_3977g1 [Puccinia sorghi]|uniref:Uncharacterized protein n=1 Tax=Puccinia sorghi TaxID=27349 RepID=A0A0L6UT43_9BASI|nr:hypothetical protein VP01_3977g1 [Puccinia sorghi]